MLLMGTDLYSVPIRLPEGRGLWACENYPVSPYFPRGRFTLSCALEDYILELKVYKIKIENQIITLIKIIKLKSK